MGKSVRYFDWKKFYKWILDWIDPGCQAGFRGPNQKMKMKSEKGINVN